MRGKLSFGSLVEQSNLVSKEELVMDFETILDEQKRLPAEGNIWNAAVSTKKRVFASARISCRGRSERQGSNGAEEEKETGTQDH